MATIDSRRYRVDPRGMVLRLPVVALSIGVLLAAAFPARAGDAPAAKVPLPPLTPKGVYRVLTQDDATSTSKCIGDPKTPLCAVETMMACWTRGSDDLCRIAMAVEKTPGFGTGGGGPNLIYRVVRSEILTDRKFPWRPARDRSWRLGGLTMHAGDIRIDTIDTDCWKGEISLAACEKAWSPVPRVFIVRRSGDRWVVVTWGEAYDPRD